MEKMTFEPAVEERRSNEGDSGDAGNDELTCVSSDDSDNVGRRSSLGSRFQRQDHA